MSSTRTRHLGLNKLARGDSVQDDDYKYGDTDRELIDLAGWLGATGHRHTGETFESNAPAVGLYLVLDTDSGALPAGTTVFYKYTLVDDRGIESLASPEASITTPDAVAAPTAPTSTILATGGNVLPGAYSYALSAYKDATSLETTAPGIVTVLLPGGATTYQVVLNLPPLPDGADGFNVYRRGIGEASFHYVESIDMGVATPPSEWVDDGSSTPSPTRGLPTANTTNAQNAVQVWLPGLTPAVPVGYTWKLYRTLVPAAYTASLLHHVVEETAEASGIITPNYLDLGYRTTTGQPPSAQFGLDNPSKIDLTDGAEVQGVLPPSHLTYKHVVEFRLPGTLYAGAGPETWRCPFEEAWIAFATASLGRSAAALGASDRIDIEKYDSALATPAWASIFDNNPAHMLVIPVGDRVSPDMVPDTQSMVKGDELAYVIEQVGGAATPTDHDLLVQVVIYHSDTTDTTITYT